MKKGLFSKIVGIAFGVLALAFCVILFMKGTLEGPIGMITIPIAGVVVWLVMEKVVWNFIEKRPLGAPPLPLHELVKVLFIHVGLIISLVFILFPAYWVAMASFKKGGSLFSQDLFPKIRMPQTLETQTVKDWNAFLLKLKNPETPVAVKVAEGLDDKAKAIVNNFEDGKKLTKDEKKTIVSSVNTMIESKTFATGELIGSAKLGEEGSELAAKGPGKLLKSKLHRLNRLILDTAFANEIVKSQKSQLTLENYHKLFTETKFWLWMRNTLIVCTCATLLALFVTVTAGYAFSRMEFFGRKWGLMTMIIIQMFPAAMAMVAIYKLLLFMGKMTGGVVGLNTLPGLILVYAGGGIPFNTWIIKGYLDGLPKELEESAYIDGATQTQTFVKIILPLMMPILAVVTIFNFIGPYADFLFPSIVMTGESQYTLAVGMRSFIAGAFSTNWTQFAAASIVGALPILVVFLAFQKFLVEGLTKGALKG